MFDAVERMGPVLMSSPALGQREADACQRYPSCCDLSGSFIDPQLLLSCAAALAKLKFRWRTALIVRELEDEVRT